MILQNLKYLLSNIIVKRSLGNIKISRHQNFCVYKSMNCGGATRGFSLPSKPRFAPPVWRVGGWQVSLSQDWYGKIKHTTRIPEDFGLGCCRESFISCFNMTIFRLLIFNLWYRITFPTFWVQFDMFQIEICIETRLEAWEHIALILIVCTLHFTEVSYNCKSVFVGWLRNMGALRARLKFALSL